jgi:hypothetical protein
MINSEAFGLSSKPVLVEHVWGDEATAAAVGTSPDLIAAAGKCKLRMYQRRYLRDV